MWDENKALVFYGCGQMGTAMAQGWLKAGVRAQSIWLLIQNPAKHQALAALGCNIVTNSADLPREIALLVLAVKPQVMPQIMSDASALCRADTLVLTVAAGLNSDWYRQRLKAFRALIRVMPNTPCALGQGVNGNFCADALESSDFALIDWLLAQIGVNVWLKSEAQMHALTAISGCGPAYVYYLVEAMAAAGEKLGFDAEQALMMAKQTVIGASALMAASDKQPAQLRAQVTSAKGVTYAGLLELMHVQSGLAPLMERVTTAAVARSRELEAAQD